TLTSQTLNLAIGLLSSITTLAAFLSMLWGLSAAAAIPFHGGKLVIPGYLVWVAAVYAVIGTVLVASVGRPLIRLQFNQERFNADFRFSLVRLRENSESVALYSGEPRERQGFLVRFASIFGNFRQIMRRTRRLNWWISGYGQAAVIFPVLVSMPAYFAKAIQIGTIMQISSAFGQVQSALSFIVNSYTDLAAWHAVVDRLRFFQQAMERAENIRAVHQGIVRRDGRCLSASHVDVSLPDGRLLLRQLSFEVRPGERLLITGPSGSGKSTLIRALAGIWPFGSGIVEAPRGDVLLCLPQKPYLPLGSLRDVLIYPFGDPASADDAIHAALRLAGMVAVSGLLSESRPWSQILSLGEQQRLAFARLFLQRPAWILMDESTSSLDEPAEAALYQALLLELPRAGIISVGHRSSLAAFHAERLAIGPAGSWHLQEIGRIDSAAGGA
ncbi:MAG TPA: ABC transporter ATP-binding protein/permease, partial [Spirochaetia bacterium]|nr:ABC transporter ATP-binding protein/permease [Spirochaetia bacterium]